MIIREIYIIKIKKYQVKFDIYYMLAGINDERGYHFSIPFNDSVSLRVTFLFYILVIGKIVMILLILLSKLHRNVEGKFLGRSCRVAVIEETSACKPSSNFGSIPRATSTGSTT